MLKKFLNGKFVAWYQNQPVVLELMGRTYPYLISCCFAASWVLAYRVSDVICQSQCKMKTHSSDVGGEAKLPLPLGPSHQHTRNGWPHELQPLHRMCWALDQEQVRGPRQSQITASLRQDNHHLALPQMPGLHLTLTLLGPQAGPGQEWKWAWASPPMPPWAEGSRGPSRRVGKAEVEDQEKGEDQVLGELGNWKTLQCSQQMWRVKLFYE